MTAPIPERSPEDVAAGVLRLRFGDVERVVPTLKIRAAREWIRGGVSRFPMLLEVLGLEDDDVDGQAAFVDWSYELGMDLLLEYDLTGALGGREWLEDHADPSQVYAALRMAARVAIPFGDEVRTLVGALLVMAPGIFDRPAPAKDDASGSERSTSLPSQPGAATSRTSRPALTRPS